MPRVFVTENAVQGLTRCRRFLDAKAPEAAQRVAQAIIRQFSRLATAPDIGRPLFGQPDLRELVISFGDFGYVALYRHELRYDAVYVLAFRHRREVGF